MGDLRWSPHFLPPRTLLVWWPLSSARRIQWLNLLPRQRWCSCGYRKTEVGSVVGKLILYLTSVSWWSWLKLVSTMLLSLSNNWMVTLSFLSLVEYVFSFAMVAWSSSFSNILLENIIAFLPCTPHRLPGTKAPCSSVRRNLKRTLWINLKNTTIIKKVSFHFWTLTENVHKLIFIYFPEWIKWWKKSCQTFYLIKCIFQLINKNDLSSLSYLLCEFTATLQ